MTPAIQALKKANIAHEVHKYSHDSSAASYGLEAVDKLGLDARRVFKTLVCSTSEGLLVVAIVPVSSMLNMKLLAKAIGAKKVAMAKAVEVEKSTGYVLGGVSPIGQKKKLLTIIDASAKAYETIYVSAGKRGLEVALKAEDLARVVDGKFDSITDEGY